MKFENKVYDVLKFLVIIMLPASATLYLGLGQIWHFPDTTEVGTSIGLVTVFLGTLLHLSTSKYNSDPGNYEGYINTGEKDEDTGIPKIELTVTKHPDDIVKGKVARLRVGKAPVVSPPVEH